MPGVRRFVSSLLHHSVTSVFARGLRSKLRAGSKFRAARARILFQLLVARRHGPTRKNLDLAPRAALADGHAPVALAVARELSERALHHSVFERVKTDDGQTALRL